MLTTSASGGINLESKYLGSVRFSTIPGLTKIISNNAHATQVEEQIVFAPTNNVSKAIVKGYRATNRFVPVGFDPMLPPAARAKLKACLAAANFLKHTRSQLLAGGYLEVGFLKGGYNILKICAKVLEGFVGLQLNSTVREGIDALGLAVRVAIIGKEIKCLLLIEWQKRTQIECLILGGDLRPGVRLS